MRFRIAGILLMIGGFAMPGCSDPAPLRVAVAMGSDGNAAALVASNELADRGITDVEVEVAESTTGSASLSLSAIDIANLVVRDPTVLAVVGHSNSEASLAASAVYNHAGIVQIAPTSTATEYHLAGDYSFRLVPDDSRQVQFILQHVSASVAGKRIAIAFVNDEYGRSLYYGMRDTLTSAGYALVHEAGYVAGADSAAMAAIGAGAARSNADLLLWFGRAPELAPALKAIRTIRPDLPVLASDGVDTPELRANPEARYTGLTFVRLVDPGAAVRRFPEFGARYQQIFNRPPSVEAVLTYDAIMLLVRAIRAGAEDRATLRQYIVEYGRARAPFNGITGPIAFNEEGDVVRSHELARVTPAGIQPISSGAEQR